MNRSFWAMVTGREPADMRIDNVRIVDVFSGEIREGSVSVGQGRILGFSRLEAREVVDGQGRWLLPGFIDGHVHVDQQRCLGYGEECGMACVEACDRKILRRLAPAPAEAKAADPHQNSEQEQTQEQSE